MAAKADSLKDEMDEALNKVEICKVDLALLLRMRFVLSHSGPMPRRLWFIHAALCKEYFIRWLYIPVGASSSSEARVL